MPTLLILAPSEVSFPKKISGNYVSGGANRLPPFIYLIFHEQQGNRKYCQEEEGNKSKTKSYPFYSMEKTIARLVRGHKMPHKYQREKLSASD